MKHWHILMKKKECIIFEARNESNKRNRKLGHVHYDIQNVWNSDRVP